MAQQQMPGMLALRLLDYQVCLHIEQWQGKLELQNNTSAKTVHFTKCCFTSGINYMELSFHG